MTTATLLETIEVPLSSCIHSRFNTRKTRDAKEIERLAERIKRNGFERTRAPWAVLCNGQYEVFAGGTRLEAVRVAGLASIPILVHDGLSDEEISRLADLDNENDEYHTPVSVVDVWAEYARLRDTEGWTQERIAQAKGVDKATVSRRIKFHTLPAALRRHVETGDLTEGHMMVISGGIETFQLAPWLTSEQAWQELAAKAVHDKGKNGEKSVRAVQEDVRQWKDFIYYADQVHKSLAPALTLYDLSGDAAIPFQYDAQKAFVLALAKRGARSIAQVKAAEHDVRTYLANNLAAYESYVKTNSTRAAREAEQSKREQELLARFVHGDCLAELQDWQAGPIRLLLTDPPYGKAYQSNRRWRTKAPDAIVGDGNAEAMPLLASAIQLAARHLADDAHVLIFCDWEGEPEVRLILEDVGLKIKGSLVWVKEEHSAGDVRGAFAPRHERIVHAVKGSPEVTPRIPDVLEATRSRETTHPAEKPVSLLTKLIESTTAPNDLVVDPFSGCASVLVAAYRLGRSFWGSEKEQGYREEGAARLLGEIGQVVQ